MDRKELPSERASDLARSQWTQGTDIDPDCGWMQADQGAKEVTHTKDMPVQRTRHTQEAPKLGPNQDGYQQFGTWCI